MSLYGATEGYGRAHEDPFERRRRKNETVSGPPRASQSVFGARRQFDDLIL